MSYESTANVSLPALETLQSELLSLSKELIDIYELVESGVDRLGEEWRDEMYQEFAENFKPSAALITEVSEAYEKWANGPLQEKIRILKETTAGPMHL